MKYLITGGCGFLGSNLAYEVLQRGEELCIFDNLSRVGAYENLGWLRGRGKFPFVYGDIRNPFEINNVVSMFSPDIIFHLAGQVAMTTSLANPRLDFEINAMGSLNLLEAVRQYAPESIIVYSSTNKVYGDLEYLSYKEQDTRYICQEYSNGFDENLKLDFHSPYGCSKGTADQYMLDYSRMFDLKTVVFRHSTIYGGRQYATYDQGWISWFCGLAIQSQKGTLKEKFTISGNGKQVRDVLYAEDAVSCYFKAVDEIETAAGQAFNIGAGLDNSLSLLELFAFLEKELGCQLHYISIEERKSDQKVFIADPLKASEKLNWTPEISYQEGIEKVLRWTEEII